MLDAISSIGLTLLLFILGYVSGSLAEKKHFKSIRQRELQTRQMVVCNFVPEGQGTVDQSMLVTGSVVVSLDYFKRILAGLRLIFGGRVKAFETLLDRGRREAVLRMKAQARQHGYGSVINVRIETSTIASKGGKNGTAGVEVLVFGTAVRYLSAAKQDSVVS